MLSAMSPQRGNVTFISAMSMFLIVVVVMMAASLSTTGSTATRIQAGSDDAAVTAAASYIGVVNDEVLLDTISWGLGFVERLLDMLDTLGGIIAAVPFLEGLGAAIISVAEALQGVIETMQDVFDNVIRQPLTDILDDAKSFLGLVNATIAAANNGYLGFIVPNGSLRDGIKSATETQYDLDYVKRRVAHSLKIVDTGGFRSGLAGAIQEMTIQQIWGKPADPPPPPAKNVPPNCPQPNSCAPLNENRPVQTFHLWPSTAGCVDPPYDPNVNPYALTQAQVQALQPQGNQWHRPCNEYLWLQKKLQDFYWKEWKSLQDLWNLLFASPGPSPPNPPKGQFMANKGPFLEKQPGDAQTASDLIRDAQGKLSNVALGNGGPGDIGQVGRWNASVKVDSCDSPTQNVNFMAWVNGGCVDAWRQDACPPGDGSLRGKTQGFYNFSCSGEIRYDPVLDDINGQPTPRCPQNTTAVPACQVFWGLDEHNKGKVVNSIGVIPFYEWPDYIVVGKPLATSQSTDYRLSRPRSQEQRDASKLLDAWKGERFDCAGLAKDADHTGCPTPGAEAEANGSPEEDFIMVGDVQPDAATQLAAKFSGRTVPSDRFSITGSKVKIFKAKAVNDRVHVSDLCARVFTKDNADPTDIKKILGIFPYTAYGVCYTILESFDALAALQAGIRSVFQPPIDFLHNFCFLDFCPLSWLGDMIQDLVDFVLGPPAPDARTFHIALGTVVCIPQLETAAKLANTGDLLEAVKTAKDFTSDSGSGTCP